MLSAADEHFGPEALPSLPAQHGLQIFLIAHPEVLLAAVRGEKHPRHRLLEATNNKEGGGGV